MNEEQIKTLKAWRDRLAKMPKAMGEFKYMMGKTISLACVVDQRFSFTAYLPECHKFDGPELLLLVYIHGIHRQTYLDEMVDFAEKYGCAVLAPNFPAGIIDITDIHNYKPLVSHGIRFDKILLSMIEQASCIWRIRADKFFLHGFSAGGQFCHRFFYLYPHLLLGISVGAPGSVTLPQSEKPWPEGISNVSEVFNIKSESGGVWIPSFGAMARVPVQFVIGEYDTDTSGLLDSLGPEIAGGGNRHHRINALRDAWQDVDIKSALDVVPGVGHDGGKIALQMQQFIGPLIRNLRV